MRVWAGADREYVALLRARDGHVAFLTFEAGTPSVQELDCFFRTAVTGVATLLTYQHRALMYGNAARRSRHRHIHLDRRPRTIDVCRHVANVYAYGCRLQDWLLRFRGVATFYLDNYLAWHQWVDGDTREARRAFILGRSVSSASSEGKSGVL